MVEEMVKKTLSQQVEANLADIGRIHEKLRMCPIQMQTVKLFADEMEANREAYNDIQKDFFPMRDDIKNMKGEMSKLLACILETNALTKTLIKQFRDVLENV